MRTNDGVAEVAVVDRGVGIPPAKRAHLFESFYRAHNGTPVDSGGLGVSLYLAEQIMRVHQGRIWFEANSGDGSTFHITLGAGG